MSMDEEHKEDHPEAHGEAEAGEKWALWKHARIGQHVECKEDKDQEC